MPEWLVERGTGETRAALIDEGRIVEARVLLDGALAAGSVLSCRLRSVGQGGRNAVAMADDGTQILLPQRPAGISEGERLSVEVSREAIPGVEEWKRPIGRATDTKPATVGLSGKVLPFPPSGPDALEAAGWSDLLDEARSGIVRFPGGELRLYATPAMTLIDVDGTLPPAQLAVAGAGAAGEAIRRLAIAGPIGIDLPTTPGKEPRQRAATALDEALGEVPFERTAVNGFGFVQIVRPRRHASLLELAQDRAAFEARALLRRAAVEGHGAATLTATPTVIACIEARPEWSAELERLRGGAVALRSDPSLAISAGHVHSA